VKRKILIIDDDVVTLKILKKYLKDDYDVTIEGSAYKFAEAMDSYEAMDLILIDYDLPPVDGCKLYDIIASNSKLNNARIAYLYGAAAPQFNPLANDKGIAGYIEKSVSKNELKEKVFEILKSESKRRPATQILILCGETGPLKEMRNTLIDRDYSVSTVRSAVDAAVYIKNHRPKLFIICRDIYKNDPNEIYDALRSRLFKANIQSVIMEEYCFATELTDKVENALR